MGDIEKRVEEQVEVAKEPLAEREVEHDPAPLDDDETHQLNDMLDEQERA
ncbi:hypothetical protein [Cellulomonas massiliensis]|nr:hypothetical protein [Cellulomonas massiliensis]